MTQLLDRKSPTRAEFEDERGSGRTLDTTAIAPLATHQSKGRSPNGF
jgi:hypothetical protein